MAGEDIILGIGYDTKEALAALNSLESETKKATTAIAGTFDALKTVAAAAVGVIAANEIKEFFSESIKQASEAQQAIAGLNFALASTGEYSSAASAQMQEFASSVQATTVFSDDAALASLKLAKNFGLTNEKAIELVKVAEDVAAQLGISLPDATSRLIASLNGNSKALAELGPQYKRLTEEQSLAGKGVALAKEQFKGAAEILAGQFSGAVAQAGNAFDDIFKAFGKILIENPTVIASVKLMKRAFEEISEAIEANKETISELVSSGIKALATDILETIRFLKDFRETIRNLDLEKFALEIGAVTVALGTLYAVFNAGGLTTVILNAGAALESFAAAAGTLEIIVSGGAILAGIESLTVALGLFAGAAGTAAAAVGALVIAALPAIGTIAAIGVAVLGVDAAIAKLRGTTSVFDDLRGKGKATANELDKFSDFLKTGKVSADGFAASNEKISDSLEGELKALIQTDGASRKADDALKKISDTAKKGGEAFGKAREEAVKFAKDLAKSNENEFQQAARERDEEIKQIKKYAKERSLVGEEVPEALFQAEDKYEKKLAKLRKEASEKDLQRIKDDAEKARKAIEDITNAPAAFVINKVLFDPNALKELNNQIAIGIGAIKNVLGGKEGAKELVSTAAGAIGDAVLPGIGPAVKEITKILALGPEAVKELVRDFVNEIPQIIDNISEAAPAFVEAFIDAMVNKGGAFKIAVALIRAMAGEGALRAVGKQIGTDAAHAIVDGVKNAAGAISQNISTGIRNGLAGIDTQIATAITSSLAGAGVQISGNIFSAFKGGGDYVNQLTSAGIATGAGQLAGVIREGLGQKITDFDNMLISNAARVRSALGDGANELFDKIKRAIVDGANEIADKVKGAFGGGGGGGGVDVKRIVIGVATGGGSEVARAFGYAKGGVVPDGFPNDSYPSALTSKERVLSVDQNNKFETILNRLAAGNFGSSGGSQTVILQIGEQQLAKVLLNLNRQGFRTA